MGAFALFDDVGRCVTAGICQDGAEEIQGGDLFKSIKTETLINLNEWTLKHGELVKLPLSPGVDHLYDYKLNEWVLDLSCAWSLVRSKRDKLLSETDWMSLKAQESGSALDPAWTSYRQSLRDVTLQVDPRNIKWPKVPEKG